MQKTAPELHLHQTLNPQSEVAFCRFCFESSKTLMKLCQCSGSIEYVHDTCIIEWIETKIQYPDCLKNTQYIDTPLCQICQTPFKARIKLGKEQVFKSQVWKNFIQLSWTFKLQTTFYILVNLIVVLWLSYFIVLLVTGLQFISISWNAPEIKYSELLSIQWVKFLIFGLFFPLHYLKGCINHFASLKRLVIDKSKHLCADVTLFPKYVRKL